MHSCVYLHVYNKLSNIDSFYRPSVPFLYEVANHVKNCHFGDYYYYFDFISASHKKPVVGVAKDSPDGAGDCSKSDATTSEDVSFNVGESWDSGTI